MSSDLLSSLLIGLLTGRGRDVSLASGPLERKKSSRRSGNVQKYSGGTGMNPINRADLRIKPPSALNVPNSIPRNIQDTIVWDTVKVTTLLTTSTTAIVESNYAFALANHPQVAQWSVLYDQWCVPVASVTFTSECPPGSTGTPAVMTTALDFDSTANIGNIATLQDFSTAQVLVMEPGAQVTRTVRPCSKPSLNATASSGVVRTWVDSATTTVNQFGVRSIMSVAQTAYSVNVTTTTWFAFRNSI